MSPYNLLYKPIEIVPNSVRPRLLCFHHHCLYCLHTAPQNRRPFNNARQGAERNSNTDVRSAQRSPRTGDNNNRPRRRAPAQLGWGDDLVSEQSLASRLWSRQQIDEPAANASTSNSRSTTSGLPTTPKQSPFSPSTRDTPRKAKMVRTPNEVEAVQSKQTSETVVVPKSKASASRSVTSEAPNTKPSQSNKAEHPVQMVDLASTNLTSLFATPVPKVQILAPSLKGLQLRDVYERRSGDYTRFASGQVIRKTARTALEPVRYARHVLGFSRHLSLKQRVKAVKVIESVVS